MIELGGVTWGTVALVLGICLLVGWAVWRHPRAIGVGALLIAAVHAVAYWTAYLDAADLASGRELLVELSVAAFLAVASALDTVFAAIRRGVERLLDAGAATEMPGVGVSVLDFAIALLALVLVSAVVSGTLIEISRRIDGSPIGGVLAALGVIFAAVGVLWTWLPAGLLEPSVLSVLLVVGAVGIGFALSAVLTGLSSQRAIRNPNIGR